jgi:trehalose 6-phosphate phosphatase
VDPRLADVLAPVRARAADAVLAFDFDGTLSPTVPVPAEARPGPGVVASLLALCDPYRQVVVVSGRPVAFLEGRLPDAVDLIGLYGLERRIGGVRADHPASSRWRPVVAEVVAAAQAEAAPGAPLDGLVVEGKGLSATLHVRTHPELAEGAGALAERLAAATGLEVRAAKASLELHPPVAVDKGTALEEVASGADALLYAGDDLGDLPAFAALDRLAARGVVTLGVVVGGPECPEQLLGRGAVHLDGQGEILDVLAALVP